ncbi:MAG: ABC transporter substrate-binding protein [Paracoccaceae bacterium]|nr:ABC transporter substrate-binding protein [Paracoccaceae bacterium]
MQRNGLWVLRLGCAVLWLATCLGAAQAETVSLMVGGQEKQIYLPVVLAEKLGYFRDEGLDVRVLSEPAGIEAADEMLAGAVQGVIGFYDHNIELQSLGKYTMSVVQLGVAPGEAEMITSRAPQVKGVGDLKGHRLGVTGLGSSTDFLTRYLLAKAGLKPGAAVLIPVSAGDTLISAMETGQVEAAMTTEPTVSRLIALHQARVLVDLSTDRATRAALGGPYPAACLYMEAGWVEAHRPVVKRLVAALVRSLHFIATHDGAEIAEHVPRGFYAGDRAMYVAALDAGKGMFSPDGLMPEGGPQSVLKVLREVLPTVRSAPIDLSRTYTNAFVTGLH